MTEAYGIQDVQRILRDLGECLVPTDGAHAQKPEPGGMTCAWSRLSKPKAAEVSSPRLTLEMDVQTNWVLRNVMDRC